MKKILTLVLMTAILLSFSGCKNDNSSREKIKIKALILPKFEVGEMTGDAPGEAQYYYEEYCINGREYDIAGGYTGSKLYVRDGVALYVTGVGKVNTSLSVSALMLDNRFDFSDAYVISTGCAGAAYQYGVMGDVYVITAVVDYDLGHRVDYRDMDKASKHPATWYHDSSYDDAAYKLLNGRLTERVYSMVKDVKINTTEQTKRAMADSFHNEAWATREPKVLKGTAVTSDTYWKGIHSHNDAEFIVKTYGCPDPFAASEMEDMGIAVALERADMLDRYIIIRDAVNMDVFISSDTPDSLWDPQYIKSLSSRDNTEVVDVFQTAMENNFLVGKVIIDAIVDRTL